MKLKVCFLDEIHILPFLETYSELIQAITSKLNSRLPLAWMLQYTDSDGDTIVLGDESDYINFKNDSSSLNSKVPKIFIVEIDVSEARIIADNVNEEKFMESHIDEYQLINQKNIEAIDEVEKDKIDNFPYEKEDVNNFVKCEEDVKKDHKEGQQLLDLNIEEAVQIEAPKEEVEENKEGCNDIKQIEAVQVFETIKKDEQITSENTQIKEDAEDTSIKAEVVPLESELIPSLEANFDASKLSENKIAVDLNVLEKLVEKIFEKNIQRIVKLVEEQLHEKTMIQQLKPVNEKSKIFVEEKKDDKDDKAVHYGIQCTKCKINPIVGIRWKCLVCLDFNICENCEQYIRHSHGIQKVVQNEIVPIVKKQDNQTNIIKSSDCLSNLSSKKDSCGVNEERKPPLDDSKPKEIAKEPILGSIFKPLTPQESEKVSKLQKCYPKKPQDELIKYVRICPNDMTIEELVENLRY